ncbi:hypothetical protein GQ53DRAFT_638808 [Thozetella sp. PMI_491]|nr:hypothetical protein GQ53DRAFT_638808 [Thozetella sp. PMI_491]
MFFSPVLVAASAGLALQAAAACTRQTLQDVTAGYLAALAGGKTTFAALSTDKITYVENGVEGDIAKGVLSQGIRIDYNRSLYDTTQCASYTEIVSTDSKHPYVIGSRLALNADNKVTRIDQNVADDGDWIFSATGTLSTDKKENWDPIPEAKRDTRDVIKAAGDAYIDGWGDSKIKPPVASGCYSLEGGTQRSGCSLSFGQAMNISSRRYTIDEELGAVDVYHNFPFLDKALPRDPGTVTNNLIKVAGGKIQFIHENTICTKKQCAK